MFTIKVSGKLFLSKNFWEEEAFISGICFMFLFLIGLLAFQVRTSCLRVSMCWAGVDQGQGAEM